MTPATTSAPAAATIPGFRSEAVRADGVLLHYWLGGNPGGPPVLLWHGFLSTGDAWHKVAPAPADATASGMEREFIEPVITARYRGGNFMANKRG